MPIHTNAKPELETFHVFENCPKDMVYGPCGGVSLSGTCEVDRSKLCTWHDHIDKIPAELIEALPDKYDKPMQSGSRFEQVLRSGEFAVSCELNPHDSADATAIVEYAKTIAPYIDAGHISDNSLASPHMCGLAVAALVQEFIDPILHMTCRDRNRLMLQADLLGAHALGTKNILCITGDHPRLGDHANAKPVFDLDAIRWIETAVNLRNQSAFLDGERRLATPPHVFIGGAAAPSAPPLALRPHRLARKLTAGADFIVTQLVFDMQMLRDFMAGVRALGLDKKTHILVGVGALNSPGMARAINKGTPGVVIPPELIKRLAGVPQHKRKAEGIKICVEQIEELKEMPGISGIDIMDLDFRHWFPTPEIVEAAGLHHRPQALA